jgi:hypothetical protein
VTIWRSRSAIVTISGILARSAVVAVLLGTGCAAAKPPRLDAPQPATPASAAQPVSATAAPRPQMSVLDSLPDSTRAMVHATTTQLPPFPNEDPGLLDPSRWVGDSEAANRRCVLELRVYERGVAVALRSSRQRRPNQSLSARYLCMERGWREPRYSGPFYVWSGNNTLIERSYRATNGVRYREDLYQYRANGLIWAYRRRERNEDQSGPSLMTDELFDTDGGLAGVSIEKTGADSLSVRVVRGKAVAEEAFRKWAAEFH